MHVAASGWGELACGCCVACMRREAAPGMTRMLKSLSAAPCHAPSNASCSKTDDLPAVLISNFLRVR